MNGSPPVPPPPRINVRSTRATGEKTEVCLYPIVPLTHQKSLYITLHLITLPNCPCLYSVRHWITPTLGPDLSSSLPPHPSGQAGLLTDSSLHCSAECNISCRYLITSSMTDHLFTCCPNVGLSLPWPIDKILIIIPSTYFSISHAVREPLRATGYIFYEFVLVRLFEL
jgi:hypothetical protein